MKFKNGVNPKELEKITSQLKIMLEDMCKYLEDKKYEPTITSIIRRDNLKSVHAYGRGVDLRSIDVDPRICYEVIQYINQKYPYGSGKQSLMNHKVDGGQYHFHLQSNC